MSQYSAVIRWERGSDEAFTDNQYSRGHEWSFDGGEVVPASSSPDIVPLPFSVAANVDPEEAFVASLSSCHMLFFLAIAAKRSLVVDEYLDHAIGLMGPNAAGRQAMTQVTLRPRVRFAPATSVSLEQLRQLHHQAHERCFIANSVTSELLMDVALYEA